jgi:hypothetical protein
MKRRSLRLPGLIAICVFLFSSAALAGQGVVRLLYTVPNTKFIENPSGDSTVTINDTSGSIATLQASLNSARSGNPNAIILIHLQAGATYSVTNAGLVLGSRECLVGSGATIRAASSSVTAPLIQITAGSTNVSVAGGIYDGNGASINAIQVAGAARVNIDRVIVKNCGLDGILLIGNGNSTYNNEMTVTRCDVSGCASHAGIQIQNSTQTAVLDNNCHNNGTGIAFSCAWADVANNSCEYNTVGIDANGGNDNVVANNTCNYNGTGIHVAGTKHMIVSNSLGNNSTAGISSSGNSNNFMDNLFTAGNTLKFSSGGISDNIIAYQAPLSAPGENYFYPPLIDDPHTNATIVNGMGRTDLTIASTTIDSVQSQYNSARSANPNNVIVLHLTGNYTVGGTPLTLQSNTCVLLSGTISLTGSTTAVNAIAGGTAAARVSISGGTLDGANNTGITGIRIASGSMIQVDHMTIVNFGSNASAISGSDSIHFSGGATPYMVTRCYINGSAGRAIWSQLTSEKALYSANTCIGTRAGIDCDSHTFGAVCLFNTLLTNTYGLWYEQGASHNTSIGNVCNYNQRYQLDVGNNADTPPTEYNSYLCNVGQGFTGLVTAAVGTNTYTSYNFLFNNVILNATILSKVAGTNNYYSQNYQSGGSLTTSGTNAETFFNSSDVDSSAPIQDCNSGLDAVVQGGSTSSGAAIVLGPATGLGSDLWSLVPTDSGYYRIVNKNSGLVMAVQGASASPGAAIIQASYTQDSTYNDEWLVQADGNGLYSFVNRRSGLCLDVSGGGTSAGTAFDQQPYTGGPNQQFNLTGASLGAPPPFSMAVTPASQSVLTGGATSYTVTVFPAPGSNVTVTLNVTGLPANVISSFTSSSITNAGSSTLNITTASNTPVGIYPLTLSGAGGGITNLSTVTLIISSGTVALPGTLLWTGASGSDTNWSTAQNWTNITSGGFGPPGLANDIVFTNFAALSSANLVNNFLDSDVTIKSFADNTTNGFHDTLIVPGGTLTVAGKVTVGTETDLGINAVVYDSISGPGSTLVVSNTAANILVRQYTAGASGGTQRATLDLSGLDTFNATANSLQIGTFVTTGTGRSAGTVYLARTNTLTLLMPAKNISTNAGIDLSDSPLANSSQSSFLYLGQQNTVYADGITVGGGRNIGWLGFNPAWSNSTVYLRGTNGGRMSRWLVGDNSGASNTGSASRGTNDFSGGSVDAQVDLMILGRGESPTISSGNSFGVVIFAQGTIDVNTLQMAVQPPGSSGGTGVGAIGTNYYGELDVNGSATLLVNSNLFLTASSGAAGAYQLQGVLNVNGGTAQLNSVTNNGGTSLVTVNAGTLILGGAMGSAARPITILGVTNASLHLSLDANLPTTNIFAVTLNAGGVTSINFDSLANVSGTNRFTLIKYTSFNGDIASFVIGTMSSGLTASLSNNVASQTIELVTMPLIKTPPTIVGMIYSAAGQTLMISGTNGTPGATYYVLGSTNLTVPLSNWTVIGSDVFDGDGSFSFGIDLDPTVPRQFFRLQVP